MGLIRDKRKIWKGHYSAVIPYLRRALGRYAIHYDAIKIGLTWNPDQRWDKHKRDGWEDMVVIYRTQSEANAVDLEKELIDQSWSKPYFARSENLVGGGGGSRSGHDWYYVYILGKWN